MTEQWARVNDAARLVRLRPDLIRKWISRGRIESRRRHGRVEVDLGQVRRAEMDLRVNGPRPGRPRVAVGRRIEEVSY